MAHYLRAEHDYWVGRIRQSGVAAQDALRRIEAGRAALADALSRGAYDIPRFQRSLEFAERAYDRAYAAWEYAEDVARRIRHAVRWGILLVFRNHCIYYEAASDFPYEG